MYGWGKACYHSRSKVDELEKRAAAHTEQTRESHVRAIEKKGVVAVSKNDRLIQLNLRNTEAKKRQEEDDKAKATRKQVTAENEAKHLAKGGEENRGTITSGH